MASVVKTSQVKKQQGKKPQVIAGKTAKLGPLEQKAVDRLGKEGCLKMYEKMVLIRAFEQRCEQAYQQRKIGGFLHLYIGEEALAVGMLAAIQENDFVTTSYRDHGIGLALGISPDTLMAELFGKVTGISRGKGGSMHFFSKEKNFLGGHGIVGGQVPVGLGAAFTAKYNQTDQVSLIFLGDGAVAQGSFHESLNMAALWGLPAIFIIENNQYAMGTSVHRAHAVTDMVIKAQGYGMKGIPVDGMNPLACYAVAIEAIEERRKNPAPILLEAKTYRYRGHSISDPANYRTKEELDYYKTIDPITRMRALMTDLGWMNEDSAKVINKQIQKEVLGSVAFSDESPFPDISELKRDVMVD